MWNNTSYTVYEYKSWRQAKIRQYFVVTCIMLCFLLIWVLNVIISVEVQAKMPEGKEKISVSYELTISLMQYSRKRTKFLL